LTYVAATRAESVLVVSRYQGEDGEMVGQGSWGLLHAGLDDAPALEDLIATPSAGASPNANDVALPDYAGLRRAALAAAAGPTYLARPVTADEHGDDDRTALDRWEPDDRRSGRGSAFGTAVHHLFQWAIRWRDVDVSEPAERARLARLWQQLRVQVPEKEGEDALRTLRGSDLWRRLRAAHEVLTEAPAAGDGAVGAIDLAYRDGEGWHLVDFKTDAVVDEVGAAGAVERHADQLNAYAHVWAAATGAAPATLAVYLTDLARCFPVEPRGLAEPAVA
jgi:ATP-dependent helicase/nuclease subunit A